MRRFSQERRKSVDEEVSFQAQLQKMSEKHLAAEECWRQQLRNLAAELEDAEATVAITKGNLACVAEELAVLKEHFCAEVDDERRKSHELQQNLAAALVDTASERDRAALWEQKAQEMSDALVDSNHCSSKPREVCLSETKGAEASLERKSDMILEQFGPSVGVESVARRSVLLEQGEGSDKVLHVLEPHREFEKLELLSHNTDFPLQCDGLNTILHLSEPHFEHHSKCSLYCGGLNTAVHVTEPHPEPEGSCSPRFGHHSTKTHQNQELESQPTLRVHVEPCSAVSCTEALDHPVQALDISSAQLPGQCKDLGKHDRHVVVHADLVSGEYAWWQIEDEYDDHWNTVVDQTAQQHSRDTDRLVARALLLLRYSESEARM